MKRFSAFIFALVVAVTVIGCAQSVTSYGFGFPKFNREAWTLLYPKDRDTESVKCVIFNDRTSALIRIVLDPCNGPTARYSAMSFRHLMRSAGYEVSEIIFSEDERGKYASFTFSSRTEHGRVVAVRRPNVDKTFLLYGRWSETNDAVASDDLERLARGLDITAYEVPSR